SGSSPLRDTAAVGDAGHAKAPATAIPLAERRRLVALELLPELGIHRLRAAKNRLLRQVVITRELVDERVRSGEVVWKDVTGLRPRQLVDRFAGRDHAVAEIRTGIDLPDPAPRVRLRKIYRILN